MTKFLERNYPFLGIFSQKLLIKIITLFFNEVININSNRKFFILLKIDFGDNSIKTLHKGLIIYNR